MIASLLLLALAGGIGFWLGVRRERGETAFWKARAQYWFDVARSRELPSFHHHPHFHATRSYPSLNAFLASVSARVERAE